MEYALQPLNETYSTHSGGYASGYGRVIRSPLACRCVSFF